MKCSEPAAFPLTCHWESRTSRKSLRQEVADHLFDLAGAAVLNCFPAHAAKQDAAKEPEVSIGVQNWL